MNKAKEIHDRFMTETYRSDLARSRRQRSISRRADLLHNRLATIQAAAEAVRLRRYQEGIDVLGIDQLIRARGG